ncbi:tRNA-specific adenosine deaminase [Paenibacillus selenitireducens]|uniref:tRNA-specific adenosine deaminase n=1 Tax=Paenibacillus selenitireducens TaxID=1324314 RepID=A0A1T2X4S7_9BACL|nr:nucleoside deaminase [Paenibacillus selenitireducens]OPA74573.1 tRNA-specific adenosine deaminase [Paenibacillus selenitireducens]
MNELQRQSMQHAISLAYHNAAHQHGKPFGAVIMKDDDVVATGINEVLASHDPTAHAEMQAIREACRKLGTSDLQGYTLYASGEPCPMCFSAIFWANIREVYYGYSNEDAESFGLSTKYLYDQIAISKEERDVKFVKLDPSISEYRPLDMWKAVNEKGINE